MPDCEDVHDGRGCGVGYTASQPVRSRDWQNRIQFHPGNPSFEQICLQRHAPKQYEPKIPWVVSDPYLSLEKQCCDARVDPATKRDKN